MNDSYLLPNHAERLACLRTELADRRLDGYLVPRGDEHQGEYVAECSERLAWLTGFTGSAGMAAVAGETAAVFVDGRYTLQAESEVDGSLFERRHLTDQPVTDWIIDTLGKSGRLGYDPWLFTPAQVTRYENACKKVGATFVPIDGNLIDAIWSDRPAPPQSPVTIHEESFSGEASADKRQRVGNTLRADGDDAVVLGAPDSIAWLLNIRGTDLTYVPLALSFAILHADGRADWFIAGSRLDAGVRRALGNGVSLHEPDELGTALDALGAEKLTVRADPLTAPVWVKNRLQKAGARVSAKSDPCQLTKACKNDTQINGMRAAHERDGLAMIKFLAWLDANAAEGSISEIAAADKLESFRREDALCQGLSFATISGAGPNGAIVHYRVTPETDRMLEPGSLYLVDSGGQYPDGTTDITRTIAIGTPSAEMRRHFTLVLKGHIGLAQSVFPKGTSGSQLDILARQALWQTGLDFDHGTGHGVGSFLSVHEGPQRISKMPNQVGLEPGMVISNEPGYYETGAYGIRIENLVLVTKADGPAGEAGFRCFETLTLAPIDRALIEMDLMNQPEVDWLNAYHSRVFETLNEQLDAQTVEWLASATAPLPVGTS